MFQKSALKSAIELKSLELPQHVIQSHLTEWNKSEDFVREKALDKLFHDPQWHDNIELGVINIKVSVLNDFYSTNIYDTTRVAEIILNCNIDQRLAEGDLGLVEYLSEECKEKNKRGIYSFASKYCAHHEPEKYPIYDYYVSLMLWYWQARDNFIPDSTWKSQNNFSKYLLKYREFHKTIMKFKEFYLSEFKLKEIDIYLWGEGRKNFPKTSGNKKESVDQ